VRVALGTVYPFDESGIHGGVESVAFNLAQALAAIPDVQLHVVSCTENVSADTTERRGSISIHWIRAKPGLGTLKALTVRARRVAAVYNSLSPDIVHAQHFSEYAVGAPAECPLVLTVHGLEWFSPDMRASSQYAGPRGAYRRLAEGRLLRVCLTKATAVVAMPGPFVPGALNSMLAGKVVRGIPNALVLDRWLAVPPTGDSARTVLCVGTVMSRKNPLALIQAFAKAFGDSSCADLVFIGDTPEADYLRALTRQATAFGIAPRVTFLGHVDEGRLVAAYSDAAVVASASVVETAPMALAEAMASARTVVATRTGGIPQMIENGISGFLVEPSDIDAMATRLRELLRDAPLRRRMGAAARQRAKSVFGSDAIAARTVALYRELLAPPSASPQVLRP
jgi:glycosyltransferase involved in cell wall biosynthesis